MKWYWILLICLEAPIVLLVLAMIVSYFIGEYKDKHK